MLNPFFFLWKKKKATVTYLRSTVPACLKRDRVCVLSVIAWKNDKSLRVVKFNLVIMFILLPTEPIERFWALVNDEYRKTELPHAEHSQHWVFFRLWSILNIAVKYILHIFAPKRLHILTPRCLLNSFFFWICINGDKISIWKNKYHNWYFIS